MADNKTALESMLKLCEKLQRKELDFITFVERFEKICFNYVSENGVKHFADGWTPACVSTLMRYVLRAYDGDKKAMRRLEVDLNIEDYDLSNDIEVIHILKDVE